MDLGHDSTRMGRVGMRSGDVSGVGHRTPFQAADGTERRMMVGDRRGGRKCRPMLAARTPAILLRDFGDVQPRRGTPRCRWRSRTADS